jgi:hypothetical protein
MARYKVLKSVAHNIGHSFASLMNYAEDDYVIGHLLRFARQTQRDTLTLDFVSEQAGPPELLQEPISEVPARYTKVLVHRHGSDRSLVRDASLTLKFDLSVERDGADRVRCTANNAAQTVDVCFWFGDWMSADPSNWCKNEISPPSLGS